jgi:hypothetical protein
VHGVEPQSVGVKLLDPIERVVHEEFAHRPARAAVEVDRSAPRRLVAIGEERLRDAVQIVAFRAEVVVHDVDQHHEIARVRCVDQRSQVVGRAVARVRRERQHTVVPPVALAREIGERHELDRRHAEVRKIVEPRLHTPERALGRERADMKLVHDRFAPRTSAPCAIRPGKCARIDHHARAVHVVGIEARRRIGHEELAVDAIAISRAGGDARRVVAVPAVRCRMQGHHPAVDVDLHGPRRRRPEAEVDAIAGDGRSEGHRVLPRYCARRGRHNKTRDRGRRG